ncbi:MAG TPA: RraA family protein [Rhizomicrobium sp.]|jgi:4-hydroxy-4-methyl-2-oxoglutarate aldolase|nr:RraA family protein [Rhizomicrobium sp.]
MTERFDPASTTRSDFPRISQSAAAACVPTAALHEAAGRIGALPSAIKPVAAKMCVAGPAFTVQSPGGDNLWLHRAIYAAKPGDVLVVHVGGSYEYGYWGEIMATAAQARGIAGLIIDGGVRDAALLEEMNFPVLSRGLCIRGTGKDFGAAGALGHSVRIGDVVIRSGDLVAGDRDGVVAIPRDLAGGVIAAAQQREAQEAEILERLRAGETTMAIYGFGK